MKIVFLILIHHSLRHVHAKERAGYYSLSIGFWSACLTRLFWWWNRTEIRRSKLKSRKVRRGGEGRAFEVKIGWLFKSVTCETGLGDVMQYYVIPRRLSDKRFSSRQMTDDADSATSRNGRI